MRMNQKSIVALLTGSVLAASTFLVAPAPAQASKKKTYQAGALVLGGLSAYLLLKGKTLPGAVAGAGAYYAYKKSKNADNRGARYPGDNYYGQNSSTTYPGDSGYNAGYNGDNSGYDTGYNNGSYNNGSYGNTGDVYAQYPDSGYNGAYNGLKTRSTQRTTRGTVLR